VVGHLLLGLDVGGTYVKATVFDLGSGVAHTRGKAVPVLHPAPGHNERDARTIWHETAAIIHEVIDLLPAGSKIDAVGVTGHGNGLYLVDRRGRPTRRAVMASDTRAAALVRGWIQDGVQDRLAPLTWNRLWPGQPGPILAWLKQHEPATLEASSHALMCKDFVRTQLVGEISTELTDQSCNGLYANATDGLCVDAFEALGIHDLERLMLGPARSTDVAGHVTLEAAELTGIPVGTPVVAGVVDNVALHLGSGVLDGSRICVAAGTWSVNQLLVPREEMVPSLRLSDVAPLAACLAAGAGTALMIEASPTSASALSWAVDHALRGVRHQADSAGTDVFEFALRRVAALSPQPDDPMFVPYLDGSRDSPTARGAWLNLSSWNGEDALLGAIVEGVCMEHRKHVERLSSGPVRLPLRLSGGAAKSALWAQRFADITGRQVEVSASQEVGTVGAAVIAGVGIGAFADLATGVAALNPARAVFISDNALVAHYEDRYHRYREISDWIATLNE
jgi:L-xylulokinase